jgi:hypothetical protein
MGGGGGAWIYPAAQTGGCHEAATGVDLIHLDEAVRETADHVCRVAEMTCLFLIQLGHGCESIGPRSILDDRLEGLHGRGVRLKESDFGVATLCSLIEISGDRMKESTNLGTSQYLRCTRPDSKLGSIHAIVPSWRSRRLPTTATPAGPAPTTTAAHFLVAMTVRGCAESESEQTNRAKETRECGEK